VLAAGSWLTISRTRHLAAVGYRLGVPLAGYREKTRGIKKGSPIDLFPWAVQNSAKRD
jgi:hypothetical protein